MRSRIAPVALIALLSACSGSTPQPVAEPAPPDTQRIPIGQLPSIDMNAVLSHTRVLSSDAFEGRAPGTKGEEVTVNYLVDQFKRVGLKPGNTDGTYIQKVPLVGITPTPAPLVLRKGSAQQTLKWKDDLVAWTKHVAETASLDNSELVFVGYGVVAPEYNWDDYKGLDVKGKTLVMLVNDPPVPDPSNASELDPKTFGGKAMTYYGRWTYKYDIGAQKGAAGVEVRIVDSAGHAASAYSGSNGNFYIRSGSANGVTFPAIVGARDATTTRPMITTLTASMDSCGQTKCHVPGGGPKTNTGNYYPIHVP